jgi:hypothetical protein
MPNTWSPRRVEDQALVVGRQRRGAVQERVAAQCRVAVEHPLADLAADHGGERLLQHEGVEHAGRQAEPAGGVGGMRGIAGQHDAPDAEPLGRPLVHLVGRPAQQLVLAGQRGREPLVHLADRHAVASRGAFAVGVAPDAPLDRHDDRNPPRDG